MVTYPGMEETSHKKRKRVGLEEEDGNSSKLSRNYKEPNG
jgi:hypothetical protein